MYEIESKYRVNDFSPIINVLGDIGAAKVSEEQILDIYYGGALLFGDVLRLRVTPNKYATLTYKNSRAQEANPEVKIREEIECGIMNPGALEEILNRIGFQPEQEVRKFRVTYSLEYHDVRLNICLDQVEGLGKFVEIEQISSEANARLIPELASELGLRKVETRSYAEMTKKPPRGIFRFIKNCYLIAKCCIIHPTTTTYIDLTNSRYIDPEEITA